MGFNQTSTDLSRMVVQPLALVEGLTGLKITDLMERVPGLKHQVCAIAGAGGNGRRPVS